MLVSWLRARSSSVRLLVMPCAGPGGGVSVPDTSEWCGLPADTSSTSGKTQSDSSARCTLVGGAALLKRTGSCGCSRCGW